MFPGCLILFNKCTTPGSGCLRIHTHLIFWMIAYSGAEFRYWNGFSESVSIGLECLRRLRVSSMGLRNRFWAGFTNCNPSKIEVLFWMIYRSSPFSPSIQILTIFSEGGIGALWSSYNCGRAQKSHAFCTIMTDQQPRVKKTLSSKVLLLFWFILAVTLMAK